MGLKQPHFIATGLCLLYDYNNLQCFFFCLQPRGIICCHCISLHIKSKIVTLNLFNSRLQSIKHQCRLLHLSKFPAQTIFLFHFLSLFPYLIFFFLFPPNAGHQSTGKSGLVNDTLRTSLYPTYCVCVRTHTLFPLSSSHPSIYVHPSS